MKYAPIILAGLLGLMAPAPASAHDAALDRNGCHENRPWGGYHCHRGPLAGQYFRSQEDAERSMPKRARKRHARPPRDPDNIFGRAEVIDGDTIKVRDQRIRLFGIDAFERRQRCRRANGRKYRCGRIAAYALADKIEDRVISCRKREERRGKRIRATCWVGAEDLSAWMVLSGWAVADTRQSKLYTLHERRAQRRGHGAWQGEFQRPRKWRKRKRRRN